MVKTHLKLVKNIVLEYYSRDIFCLLMYALVATNHISDHLFDRLCGHSSGQDTGSHLKGRGSETKSVVCRYIYYPKMFVVVDLSVPVRSFR